MRNCGSGNEEYSPLFKAVASTLVVSMSACTTVPVGPGAATPGGFLELRDNSEPRFVHLVSPAPRVVGTLYVSGNAASINGEPAKNGAEILNNSFLSTGPETGARVDFIAGSNGICGIAIKEFRLGEGYGETSQCRHSLEVPQGKGTSPVPTAYHVAAGQQQSAITVLTGQMQVWLNHSPGARVTVGGSQEVILTPTGLLGPRPVPTSEIQRRTEWRKRYQYAHSAPNKTLIGLGALAAIGAIVGIVLGGRGGGGGKPPRLGDWAR